MGFGKLCAQFGAVAFVGLQLTGTALAQSPECDVLQSLRSTQENTLNGTQARLDQAKQYITQIPAYQKLQKEAKARNDYNTEIQMQMAIANAKQNYERAMQRAQQAQNTLDASQKRAKDLGCASSGSTKAPKPSTAPARPMGLGRPA
jgi:hypothetical protein